MKAFAPFSWLIGWMYGWWSWQAPPVCPHQIFQVWFSFLVSPRRPTDLHTYCRRQHTSFSIYENVFLNSKRNKTREKIKILCKNLNVCCDRRWRCFVRCCKRNHKSFLLICARFRSKPPISTIWVGSSANRWMDICFGIPAKTYLMYFMRASKIRWRKLIFMAFAFWLPISCKYQDWVFDLQRDFWIWKINSDSEIRRF